MYIVNKKKSQHAQVKLIHAATTDDNYLADSTLPFEYMSLARATLRSQA